MNWLHKVSQQGAPSALQLQRWKKALSIARILFEDQGYHSMYLDEIEQYIMQSMNQAPSTQPKDPRVQL